MALKHTQALEKFIKPYTTKSNVVWILVSGSSIHSALDKNSDIDVYIILKKSKTRVRGNTYIGDIEIEYFINPISQIEEYLAQEENWRKPSTAHMFTHCRILYQKWKELSKLIKTAKNIIQKKRKKMTTLEIELAKYTIDDLIKDLEDVLIKNDNIAFSLISQRLLSVLLETFYSFHRIYADKEKRLQVQLQKIDPKFLQLLQEATKPQDRIIQYQELQRISHYIEHLIGWTRGKERKLKSKSK